MFVWSSETEGGRGLQFQGVVREVSLRKRELEIEVELRSRVTIKFGIADLSEFRDIDDGTPLCGLARKIYRHSHKKVALLSQQEADFLRAKFAESGVGPLGEKSLPQSPTQRKAVLLAVIVGLVALISLALTIHSESVKGLAGSGHSLANNESALESERPVRADPSESFDTAPDSKREAMRLTEGAPVQIETVRSITDSAMISAVQHDVISAAYACTSVKALWKLSGSKGVQYGAYKVDCGSDGTYQITALNGREFVKPWTGILLGATGD